MTQEPTPLTDAFAANKEQATGKDGNVLTPEELAAIGQQTRAALAKLEQEREKDFGIEPDYSPPHLTPTPDTIGQTPHEMP